MKLSINSLLTKEEVKEMELINNMDYEEMTEYFEKENLKDANKQTEIRPLGMSIEEFMEKYDAVDLSSFLESFGVKFPKL